MIRAFLLFIALTTCTYGQGFYNLDTEAKIGADSISNTDAISLHGHTEFQVVVIMKRVGDQDAFGRVVEWAAGGNGLRGWYVGSNAFSAADERPIIQWDSGGNVNSASDAYIQGDIMMLTATFSKTDSERIFLGVNGGDATEIASGDIRNTDTTSSTHRFRIGGSSWGKSRDPDAETFKVLLYNERISQKQMNMISLTRGAMYPVDGLVAAWATCDFSKSSGEAMDANTVIQPIKGAYPLEADQDTTTSTTFAENIGSNVGHAWTWGGTY